MGQEAEWQLHRPRDDAELPAAYLSMRKNLRHHPLCRAARHRKAQSLGEGDDRRIDADDAPARIQERATGVAWIDRRRMLNDVLDEPPIAAAHAAFECADDAGRDGRMQAKRTAHRDQQLADA